MRESRRIEAVQSPVIPIIGEMIRRRPGTISLGQGVVHYGPPPQAAEAVTRFFTDSLNNRYSPVYGIPPLVEALERKLAAENGIHPESVECIIVTAGSNMGFMNALLAIADPDDEIIIQSPYYFNHEMAIQIANCVPVVVPTDDEYQLDLDAIRQAVTPKTRAIVTISPNNPTGAVYSESALREINELCATQGIYHIHDEAYEYFTYDGADHFSPGSIPDSDKHTISLFSLSKSYGFASWRIGYMVVPKQLVPSVKKIQDTNLICAPVISQFAALGALEAGAAYCRSYSKGFSDVRSSGLATLSETNACSVPRARGAFYFLITVDCKLSSMDLVSHLIEDHGVAVLPGHAFGVENRCCIRASYGALSPEMAKEGIERLVRGLHDLTSRRV